MLMWMCVCVCMCARARVYRHAGKFRVRGGPWGTVIDHLKGEWYWVALKLQTN